MSHSEKIETKIDVLGPAKIESKIRYRRFVDDSERVLYQTSLKAILEAQKKGEVPISFEMAGPRKHIYFDPSKIKCAIVTCGGLCPGLNDVIRAIVLELHYIYRVKNILGIKYGLQGFIPKYGHEVLELTPEVVTDIHAMGGTILGSSRGEQDIGDICDALERMNLSILFMIGGDGTLQAAKKIYQEISRRGLKIGIIGIPKTIDNDIHLVEKTFGFDTAVEYAAQAIRSAHVESKGAPNGIGLVKVMGRCSGFIAAAASLALKDVNFCLVPEVDFDLHGPRGLLNALKQRLKDRHHAVIVVAEGAGQKFFKKQISETTGNPKLGDIGIYLKEAIEDYFKKENFPVTLKYIDPSYIIRSVPANSNDHIYCGFLAQNAVHAGMAGKTGMVIGSWNSQFVHIPLVEVTRRRRYIDPEDALWLSVMESTGQPCMVNDDKEICL